MKKYTLKHPIKDAEGKEITELEFGQLKAKHLVQIPGRFLELAMEAAERSEGGGPVDMKRNIPEMIKYFPDLFSALTGHPVEVIGELEIADLFGAFEAIDGDFFGESGLPQEDKKPAS